MASKVPSVKLNNGKTMPVLGLGTWNLSIDQVAQTVKDAVDVGYRHFDCASIYGNESGLGKAINAKIYEGVIKREDVFITSKLWNSGHHPDYVIPALRKTLENMNIPYLDLYMIHWPYAFKEGDDDFPRDANGKIIFSDVDYVDTWESMEKAVELGLTKSIGFSNFNWHQTERILDSCRIKPAVSQIECNPYLSQRKLSPLLQEHGITVTAYSPLGSPGRPAATANDPVLMKDPKIVAIAKKVNKTPAQVLIRYQLQRGHAVIPKSVSKSRLASNFDIFNFELSNEDMNEMTNMDRNIRISYGQSGVGHPFHPFENVEF